MKLTENRYRTAQGLQLKMIGKKEQFAIKDGFKGNDSLIS